MTDKEKMNEFENWLKYQIKDVFKGYIETEKSGDHTATLVKKVVAIVLLEVLNKFRAIERREDEKV